VRAVVGQAVRRPWLVYLRGWPYSSSPTSAAVWRTRRPRQLVPAAGTGVASRPRESPGHRSLVNRRSVGSRSHVPALARPLLLGDISRAPMSRNELGVMQ